MLLNLQCRADSYRMWCKIVKIALLLDYSTVFRDFLFFFKMIYQLILFAYDSGACVVQNDIV